MSMLTKIMNKHRSNKVVVEIVQEIVSANTYMPDEKIMKQLSAAFVSNRVFEKVRDDIMAVYEVCRNEVLKRVILKDSFYKNCRVTNFVVAASLEKRDDLIPAPQIVRLRVHYVNSKSVCVQCYQELSGDDVKKPDLDTEMVVQPKEAWFFSQCYICNYCFTNKMYTKV
ncbi:ORF115 similar to XcGV ORF136 [Cydia pomonella granulovirus]|uniref:ORF115 n=2 Tax=Cydia pomonella granulosis virus TaxID=28289 RepID=A0A097P0V0_GVCP|nr:ORF115 similar to XcGV ORF136 [Cydia pomonella granulovirus]AAK70775.1 ORF115 similar to XcGV ORF136 [Cydia pomonella granulovirus]AIU36762.1 ORF115 [Cydia pomonella granulovirus]AIU36898.1 ORF115 [Cydia pomonella granulovirus]AIU37041.1 ORF115 [Cydia pomonella granulovirus]AIU37183.1 ORF115 [Cydia pomonella granulovirus]